MDKILITPRSYGKTDMSVLDKIRDAGFEPVVNPYGQILTKEQMIAEIADCVGIIVGVDPLDKDVIDAAPKLRAIAKYGVGVDNIDVEYAKQKGIPVSITRAANANAVADFAFALLCACARKVIFIDKKCHVKDWSKNLGLDIYGKTLGILGLGAIGKGLAQRASGFNMKVLAYDIFWDDKYALEHSIQYAAPEDIFKSCDFISLHLPLTEETSAIINASTLSMMKETAVLINTARGGLIDDNALIQALEEHKIAAAGIDAFNEEPPKDERWYHLDNLIMSSHAAASTNGASETMSRFATDNILSDLR